MNSYWKIAVLLILVRFLTGCNGNVNVNPGESNGSHSVSYARFFDLKDTLGGKLVTVFDPWQNGGVLQSYFLYQSEKPLTIPAGAEAVEIPVKRIAVTSLDNVGFLDELGAADKIVAVTDAGRIYNTRLKKRMDSGVVNLGPAVDFDIEKMISAAPEVVFTTTYSAGDHKNDLLKRAGITAVINLAWMEKSPLGRAEWVKLTGAFLGLDSVADSVFTTIERKYNALKDSVKTIEDKPLVLVGAPWKGVWYMPGGKSYKAGLIADAGGLYVLEVDTSTGSVGMDFEKVFSLMSGAAVWIEVPYLNSAEMLSANSLFGKFKAFGDSAVFNNFGRANKLANDYWETGVCRPDIVLKDLINIFHGKSADSLTFYKRLEY